MTAILACAGHVLIDLPLFGSPVLLLAGAVTWIVRSERRRASEEATASPAFRPQRHPFAAGRGSIRQ